MAVLVLVAISGAASGLTLDEAIALGRQRSLNMQDPKIDRQKVNGRITEAWSNALPQVDGTVAYQRVWQSPVIFFPNFLDTSGRGPAYVKYDMQQKNGAVASATLTQPIYTFGRVGAGLKAAYAARRSNDHMLANTDKTVSLEVMKRFWAVLLMRDVVEARRSSLAISDSSLTRVKRMRDVGLMSDYDVLRTQVQASNQIPPLRAAENSLHISELALKEYLGVPLDTNVTVDGNLADYTIDVRDTNATGVEKRDDLEALRDLVQLNRNVYKIYASQYFPVLGAQFNYQWQWANNNWDILPTNYATSYYGGLGLTIPIWNSGKTAGQVQQYKADWKKSELDLQKAERGASLQYQNAVNSYTTALTSEDAAKLAVQQAEQARAIAQTKFAQGQITTLEMDAAQLDELVAKTALAQAKYDRLVAAAEARMAAGLSPYSK
jgi:outer membrane protein